MRKISICAKCSDLFYAHFSEDGEIKGDYNGYVPDWFPEEHYSDYVELEIDIDTGLILNWKKPSEKDLDIFKNSATV